MAVIVSPEDLASFMDVTDPGKVMAMIEDVEARAFQAAPCLRSETDQDVLAVARSVLRQVIIRWANETTGALTQRQETVGSVTFGASFDTRRSRRGMFQPDEIADLSALCGAGTARTSHVGWLA